jgi:hypothetical protein
MVQTSSLPSVGHTPTTVDAVPSPARRAGSPLGADSGHESQGRGSSLPASLDSISAPRDGTPESGSDAAVVSEGSNPSGRIMRPTACRAIGWFVHVGVSRASRAGVAACLSDSWSAPRDRSFAARPQAVLHPRPQAPVHPAPLACDAPHAAAPMTQRGPPAEAGPSSGRRRTGVVPWLRPTPVRRVPTDRAPTQDPRHRSRCQIR